MLYDRHLKSLAAARNHDRRTDVRECQAAEVVISWICPALSTVRYEMLDRSTNGLRIRSSSPLVTGMLGKAVRILPQGHCLNQTVSIVWTKVAADGTYIEAGLHFQAPEG